VSIHHHKKPLDIAISVVALSLWIFALPRHAFAEEVAAKPELQTEDAKGETIYRQHCAPCHDHAHDNIPMRIVIAQKSPEGIVSALTTGPMQAMAAGLSAEDRRSVAQYITGKAFGSDPNPEANICASTRPVVWPGDSDWSYWGRDRENTLFQPQPGRLSAEAIPRLKLKWSFAYPGGSAIAEPIAVGDRLFLVTSGGIFAIDAETGCTDWHREEIRGVKMATAASLAAAPKRVLLFLGDATGNLTAIDASTGDRIWAAKVDNHPTARLTGPVSFYGDRIYAGVSSMEDPLSHDPAYPCCTFRGSVVSLDAATGKMLWKSYSITKSPEPLQQHPAAGTQLYGPAGGAIYAPLTIDVKRNAIYAVTAESYHRDPTDGSNAVIAFDLDSGARKWVRQPRPNDNAPFCKNQDVDDACVNSASSLFEFAAPAVLATTRPGKQLLLVGQKSGVVYALDPDRGGKLVWETRVGQGGSMGGVLGGFSVVDGTAYVAVSDSTAKSPNVPGGLVALDVATGRPIWRTPAPDVTCSWGSDACSRAQPSSVAAIPGLVFSGSSDGHMRAYRMKDGSIAWDFDTGREFNAVNGVKGAGGGIGGYPVIVAHDSVFVTSGAYSNHPGNVLLSFTADGN